MMQPVMFGALTATAIVLPIFGHAKEIGEAILRWVDKMERQNNKEKKS